MVRRGRLGGVVEISPEAVIRQLGQEVARLSTELAMARAALDAQAERIAELEGSAQPDRAG